MFTPAAAAAAEPAEPAAQQKLLSHSILQCEKVLLHGGIMLSAARQCIRMLMRL
jgi:hypothetical protein